VHPRTRCVITPEPREAALARCWPGSLETRKKSRLNKTALSAVYRLSCSAPSQEPPVSAPSPVVEENVARIIPVPVFGEISDRVARSSDLELG
jgi:hypothetical protein